MRNGIGRSTGTRSVLPLVTLGLAIAGSSPRGIAIDSSGNVWVATGEQGGVVELVGAATPVRTPLNTRAALP